jgi:hypothetical protein
MKLPPRHVQVVFVACDGDPAYDKEFKRQHKVWYPKSAAAVLLATDAVWNTRPFFVSDLLHAAKNVRTRLLTYVPVLYCAGMILPVNVEEMKRVLNLGEVFTDLTSTGKMRDAYPIALFRLEHVLTLFDAELFAEAVYLLAWALLFRAVLSDKFDLETRVFTLGVALLCLLISNNHISSPRSEHLITSGKRIEKFASSLVSGYCEDSKRRVDQIRIDSHEPVWRFNVGTLQHSESPTSLLGANSVTEIGVLRGEVK